MDYELESEKILRKFHLSDWERTWIEARYHLSEKDIHIWNRIRNKYLSQQKQTISCNTANHAV